MGEKVESLGKELTIVSKEEDSELNNLVNMDEMKTFYLTRNKGNNILFLFSLTLNLLSCFIYSIYYIPQFISSTGTFGYGILLFWSGSIFWFIGLGFYLIGMIRIKKIWIPTVDQNEFALKFIKTINLLMLIFQIGLILSLIIQGMYTTILFPFVGIGLVFLFQKKATKFYQTPLNPPHSPVGYLHPYCYKCGAPLSKDFGLHCKYCGAFLQ